MNDFTGRVRPDEWTPPQGSVRTVTVALDTAQYQVPGAVVPCMAWLAERCSLPRFSRRAAQQLLLEARWGWGKGYRAQKGADLAPSRHPPPPSSLPLHTHAHPIPAATDRPWPLPSLFAA